MQTIKVKPILKWPGGKEREIPKIFSSLPKNIENYYEPFVGGGAVFVNINAKRYFINDKASELANLYRTIKSDEQRATFIHKITLIDSAWLDVGMFVRNSKAKLEDIYYVYKNEQFPLKLKTSIADFIEQNDAYFSSLFSKPFNQNYTNFKKELSNNLYNKLTRMQVLECKKGDLPKEDIISNIESAIKSAFYMHMRFLLNRMQEIKLDPIDQTVVFYFIRNYAYSGMFRYNKNGEFNVPYGGIGYNNNSFKKKIDNLNSDYLIDKLHKTEIGDTDFYDFMNKYKPNSNDFIFLDPPYDTEFSTYNKNEFEKNDQKRLADYLINECPANWMIVIKNTEYIFQLYKNPELHLSFFDKKYQVSFMNRNNRDVEHLIVTNYKP